MINSVTQSGNTGRFDFLVGGGPQRGKENTVAKKSRMNGKRKGQHQGGIFTGKKVKKKIFHRSEKLYLTLVSIRRQTGWKIGSDNHGIQKL